MARDGARRTELVERALGDAREDVHHRVVALLLVGVGERQHCTAATTTTTTTQLGELLSRSHRWSDDGRLTAQAVGKELAAGEGVHQVELADDVDQAEQFAKEVAHGVHVVLLEVHQQVVDQHALLGGALLDRAQSTVVHHRPVRS